MPGIKRLYWNVYTSCSQTPRNGMLHFCHSVMWRKSCETSEQRVQQHTSSASHLQVHPQPLWSKTGAAQLSHHDGLVILRKMTVSRPIIDNLAAWSLGPCVTAVDHRRTLDIPGCRGGPLLHGSAPATLQYKKSPENSMDNGKANFWQS